MGIKLVRTDSTEPCKIQLLPGEHIIGRGKLLQCDDKRVSRNHGQLLAFEDCLKLYSLSQNPCFYKKNNTYQIEILNKDCSITLSNGDKFGLLPDKFWYEIIYYCNTDIDDKATTDLSETNTEEYACDDLNATNNELNIDNVASLANTETLDDTERPESPSLIANNSNETCQSKPEQCEHVVNCMGKANDSESKESKPEQCENVVDCMNNLNDSESKESNTSPSNNKRSHSVEPEDVKKIKTEHEIKTEPEDVQPGPSIDKPPENDKGDSNTNDNKAPVQNPRAPARERCMYGAACYRKNPLHMTQFSHPRDDDWGDGAQVECPYGIACAKRDPRHLRDHSHPPGHRPPPPRPPLPGMQVVHRQGKVFYINAHAVNFHDDHFEVVDSDGDSVDYDYEF